MTYTQQITQEKEALDVGSRLKLVQKYSPETETYLSFKYRLKNRRYLLKKLPRAGVSIKEQKTSKTLTLHPRAISIAETVLNKMVYDKEDEVILTQKYLHKITDCLSDQNKRHIQQLANLFTAQYKRSYLKSNIFHERCYVFKLNPAIIEELKDSDLLESEFYPAKKLGTINNKNISNEIKIRSSRANFFQSNLNFKEALVETTNPIPATVTPIQSKPTRPANKRKTKTREEHKQRKNNNVVRNGFLSGGKSLSEIQPYLTDEICDKLRSASGRAFTNKAIREITKAIAASEKGRKALFRHINGVVAYLTPALANEKRDPNKTGSENYYTLAGMSDEDKLWKQREKYLAAIEEEAIQHVCPENHFKAKLANALKHSRAYEFLSALAYTKMAGNKLIITLNRQVALTEPELDIVLFQARAVFDTCDASGNWRYVEQVEYVVDSANANFRNTEQAQELQLPQGIWGKIVSCFIEEFDWALYQHWLSGLEVTENLETKIIQLKSNSNMVKDRIEQNYLPFLNRVCCEMGINRVELVR